MLSHRSISIELARKLKAFLMDAMAQESSCSPCDKERARELHRELTEPELFQSGTDTYAGGESGSESKF